jgi:hypothetical protein
MIIVRVFMKPKGIGPERLMGEAHISNDCTGDKGVGNYDVELSRINHGGYYSADHRLSPWKQGKVLGFPRLRLSVWDLLYRALHSVVATRN